MQSKCPKEASLLDCIFFKGSLKVVYDVMSEVLWEELRLHYGRVGHVAEFKEA
jgi:hypothetical protein